MHCRTDTQCLRLSMSDEKELVRSQQVILQQRFHFKRKTHHIGVCGHTREAKSSKLHRFDCSQKHAHRALERQPSDMRAEYDTSSLVSLDRAASSFCFDSTDYGPPGTWKQRWVISEDVSVSLSLQDMETEEDFYIPKTPKTWTNN